MDEFCLKSLKILRYFQRQYCCVILFEVFDRDRGVHIKIETDQISKEGFRESGKATQASRYIQRTKDKKDGYGEVGNVVEKTGDQSGDW